MIHGTTIVGTIGLAAPMSMLTICAADNLCGEGNSYNGHLVETQSLDSAYGARHELHPDLLRRVAWPGSGRIFPLPDEADGERDPDELCARALKALGFNIRLIAGSGAS